MRAQTVQIDIPQQQTTNCTFHTEPFGFCTPYIIIYASYTATGNSTVCGNIVTYATLPPLASTIIIFVQLRRAYRTSFRHTDTRYTLTRWRSASIAARHTYIEVSFVISSMHGASLRIYTVLLCVLAVKSQSHSQSAIHSCERSVIYIYVKLRVYIHVYMRNTVLPFDCANISGLCVDLRVLV